MTTATTAKVPRPGPRPGTFIAKVRDYLESGRSLTHAEAFTNFGTMRLSSCIEELRHKYGFADRLVTETKVNPVTRLPYASYRMKPELKVRDRVEVISIESFSGYGPPYYNVGDRGRVIELCSARDVKVQFAKLRETGQFRSGNGAWYVPRSQLKVLDKDTV